jgi:3-hydroxybutyryl-CoA dehydrogenase
MIKVGIVGSGAMGSGIAQVAATAGHEVVVLDANPQALQKAATALAATMAKLVEKGKITAEKAASVTGNISFVSDIQAYAGCGLVIEAIVENLDVKKKVFADIEAVAGADCILASNTSSLSIASIASVCKAPGRVVGIHFFNPAPLMELVEIIPAVQSDDATVAAAKALIDSWGKKTVIAKDTPGFIVNRVARPFYGEALRIYEEGVADMATIDWAMTQLGGFRMGPFTLMDYIGHDVNYVVTETVFREFFYDPRYKPSFSQKRLLEAGWLGRKSGRGFYNYAEGATLPEPAKNEALGQEICNRVLVMLINEAADACFLNIASREDVDIAMTKGVNYPKGLLRWADEIGIATVVERLDALYHTYHEDRYRCSPLLRKMAAEEQTFFA